MSILIKYSSAIMEESGMKGGGSDGRMMKGIDRTTWLLAAKGWVSGTWILFVIEKGDRFLRDMRVNYAVRRWFV